MKSFRDLTVWRISHRLALAVYQAGGAFPVEERYALSNRPGRAGFSIPTNIAEGCGRYGDREFARFASIAMGSASETEYLLLLANDLGFLHTEAHGKLSADENGGQTNAGDPYRQAGSRRLTAEC